MPKLKGRVIVLDKWTNPKNGSNWYTFLDADLGGQFKVIVNGELEGVQIGDSLAMDINARIHVGQAGGAYIAYQSGGFGKNGS